jgi:hypothetical protein
VVADAMGFAEQAVALDAFHNAAADNTSNHAKESKRQHFKPFEV